MPKRNSSPKIGEPYEIAEIAWVNPNEVLEKFTSDVHPVVQKFILAQARTRKGS